MGNVRRQGVSYTSITYIGLTCVIFYLCLCGSNAEEENGLKIYRSTQDIFTNVLCNSGACGRDQCEDYNAECYSPKNCEYCRCLGGKNIFMDSGNNQRKRKCRPLRKSQSDCVKYIYYDEKDRKNFFQIPTTGECQLNNNFTYTRNGQEWKDGSGEIFTMEWRGIVKNKNKKSSRFMIQPTNNSKSWNGSLIKFNVSCQKGNWSREYCLVLKLESLPRFQEIIDKESSESSGASVPLVISITAITLLLIALVLALGCLAYYRRRKRETKSKNNDLCPDQYSKEICENEDPIYETIDDEKAPVPPGQPGKAFDTYIYPKDNVISHPPLVEHEYAYAKEIDFPKFSVGAIPSKEIRINNGVLDRTSAKPEQQSDNEMKCNFVRDTDTPRANMDQMEVQEDHADTAYLPTVETDEASTNDLYKFPGVNIPTEMGYINDKDADVLGVNADKTAMPNQHGNVVYQTLEPESATTDNIPTEMGYINDKDADVLVDTVDKNQHGNVVYQTLEPESATTDTVANISST